MRLRDESRLKKKLKSLGGPKNPIWTAIQGDGGGTVDIPGHKTLWYVRPTGMDLPVVVRRGNATIAEGAPVWVGRDVYQKKVVRVLDMQENGEVGGGTTSLPDHAENHYEDSVDPVFITTKQITDELAWISGNLEITINPGWVKVNGRMVQVQQTIIDVTSNIPVSGAQYTLVRANDTGVIDLQDGTPVDFFVDLTDADIPLLADNYALLAVLRLYAGQTVLSQTVGASDLIDARYLPSGVSASSVTYSVVTKTTDYTITDADDFILCDATSGNITITMPAAAGRTGRLYTVKKIDTSANWVIITGLQTLFVANQAITLFSTGAVWLASADRYEAVHPKLVVDGSNDTRIATLTEDYMIFLDTAQDELYLGGTTNGVKIDKGGILSTIGSGVLGSVARPVTSKSSNYTLTDSDWLVVVTASRTITLPTAVGRTGKTFIVIKDFATAGGIFLDGDGTETINGAENWSTDVRYSGVEVISNGSNWYINNLIYPSDADIDLSGLHTGRLVGSSTVADAMQVLDDHGHTTDEITIDPGDTYSGLLSGLSQLDDALYVLDGLVSVFVKKDLTYYVNGTTGSDENDGLSSGTALATIQAAVDKFKGYVVSGCFIEIAAGTYVENVVVAGISVPVNTDLQFNGDDARICVGCCYMHGGVLASSGNRGGGTMSLATGGGGGSAITITVTGTTANPAFSTDGIASGDKLFTWDGTTLTEYNVASTSSNVITLVETTTAPSLNTNGRYMIIQPAVRIVPSSGTAFISNLSCRVTGVYAKSTTVAGFNILSGSFVLNRCLGYCTAAGDATAGIFADRAAYLITSQPTMGIGNNGLTLRDGCNANIPYGHWHGTTRGVYCLGSRFDASNCGVAVGPSTAGMYAGKNGYIYAAGVAATNFAATKWSPATTDTLGNNMGAITFS